jgi:hypothetical protein
MIEPLEMGSLAGLSGLDEIWQDRGAQGVAIGFNKHFRHPISRSTMASTSQLTHFGWLGVFSRVRMTERNQQITRPLIASSAVLSNPY